MLHRLINDTLSHRDPTRKGNPLGRCGMAVQQRTAPCWRREPFRPVSMVSERRGRMSISGGSRPAHKRNHASAPGPLLSLRSLVLLLLAGSVAMLVATRPAWALPIGVGIGVLTLLHGVVGRE